MCLAIPVKIIALQEDGMAIVDAGGVEKQINVGLLDEVEVGDYVILHVGYALSRIDEAEARRTLELFNKMASEPGQGGQ